MDESQPWHRMFGLALMDFFRGLPVTVEMEKDLSLKKQLLDVVILRKEAAPLPCQLPDGFDELAAHNLITFKSHRETLDGWAMLELLGHYVNYRKQVSPSMNDLLPETDFRLYAVSARFPAGLARVVPLTPVQAGVYEVGYYTGTVRLVVVHQLPQEVYNALMHLFSAQQEGRRYGAEHYQQKSDETSKLLLQLFDLYRLEGMTMDALEQMARDMTDRLLRSLPPEERLKGMPPEERLQGLSLKDRLKGLTPEDIKGSGLPPEAIEALQKQLQEDDSSTKPG